MKRKILLFMVLTSVLTISKAQTTAMQMAGLDCNGVSHDLFADLDAGNAVLLHFFMPSCGSCPPPAQKIQAMANNVMKKYPGKIKGYAIPFNNSTTCSYTSTWCSSNGLSLYMPYDSGATQVAYYGGFGMPTVVLLGGKNHRVMFLTLSFSTSDTAIMRDSILSLFKSSANVPDLPKSVSSFTVFPNPVSDNVSISLVLKESSNLLIDIADITGKQLVLITEGKQSGNITEQFATTALPSGIYLIRVRVDRQTLMQKLIVTH